MNIYRRKYSAGKVVIPLRQFGPNMRGIPLILFVGPDSSSGAAPLSCGGQEILLSRPGGAGFSKCN